MPCKIQIKQSLEALVDTKTQQGLLMKFKDAQDLALKTNMEFKSHVVSFNKTVEGFTRSINIDSTLVDKYYDKQLKQQILDNTLSITSTTFSETQYQKSSTDKFKDSSAVIRDLAERLSARIGSKGEIIGDYSKEYAGSSEGNSWTINIAKATLDTPIHEIVGHPIIRAIKGNVMNKTEWENSLAYKFRIDGESQDLSKEAYSNYIKQQLKSRKLYQNLLKELEIGYGKEVLDRVKKEYVYKEGDEDLIERLKNRINDLEKYKIRLENKNNLKDNLGYITKPYMGSLVELILIDKRTNEIISLRTPGVVKNAFTIESATSTKEELDQIFNDFIQGKFTVSYGKTIEDFINEPYQDISKLDDLKQKLKDIQFNTYILEEQQEEALVQLLGELTAGKIKDTKENKNLITFLKELLKQMTAYMRSLFNSKEIDIDKLSADMTLNDLANLIAYTNSKIILPGSKVQYTTPDNKNFATYQEASSHISKLFNESKNVDLNDVLLSKKVLTIDEVPKDFIYNAAYDINKNPYAVKGSIIYNSKSKQWVKIGDEKYIQSPINSTQVKNVVEQYNQKMFNITQNDNYYDLQDFINRNKEFEQSKDIIETWKKVNNIVYNPEEVYSRGQGFYSAIGAYSRVELDLLLQNLLHHIEDNKKAGGVFAISAFTKPIDKKIGHLEGESSVRFVIYPESKDILWAAPTDVYSGSVWDAAKKVSTKKSELLGVSHTKYPSLNNVYNISPNLASIIDNRSHHHNELGIELTTTNFRLEYDNKVPYEVKKLVDSINSILDERYGKMVKPSLKPVLSGWDEYYEVANRAGLDPNSSEFEKYVSKNYQNAPIKPTQTKENTTSINNVINSKRYVNYSYHYEGNTDGTHGGWWQVTEDDVYVKGAMFDTEQEAKDFIKSREDFIEDTDGDGNWGYTFNGMRYVRSADGTYVKSLDGFVTTTDITKEEYESNIPNRKEQVKEFNDQALINTKIARLKEVAKKYPRSLITSTVISKQSFEKQFQKNTKNKFTLELDLKNLNLTPEVVNYLYQDSRLKTIGLDLNSYNVELSKLISNLRTSFTNQEILEKIKCL